MKTAIQWLAAEQSVIELKRDYEQLISWEYDRKVAKIAKAKEIAKEFGVGESIYLNNCTPEEYLYGLARLLGRAAVDAIE